MNVIKINDFFHIKTFFFYFFFIQRINKIMMPTNPTELDDLQELPERYTQTFPGENVLLYDSSVACEQNTSMLHTCDIHVT